MTTVRTTAIVIASLLALAALAPASAEKPQFREESDKLVLQNDHVSVWFQGKKPMLRVLPADVAVQAAQGAVDVDAAATIAAGEAGFTYKFTRVVEYNDLNGDGLPEANEIVASLNLEKASAWTVDTNGSDEQRVVLDLRLEAPVSLGNGGVPIDMPENVAVVGLVFTIASEATVVNASGIDVSVPATSIKYDFIVEQWPFVNADANRLALVTKVAGELEVENGTGVEEAQVLANDTQVGALSWTTLAVGDTNAGETIDVPVKTAISAAMEGEATIVHTYDAAGLVSLVHDPTIGTPATPEALQGASAGEDARQVPGAGALLVAAAAVGVALASRRR